MKQGWLSRTRFGLTKKQLQKKDLAYSVKEGTVCQIVIRNPGLQWPPNNKTEKDKEWYYDNFLAPMDNMSMQEFISSCNGKGEGVVPMWVKVISVDFFGQKYNKLSLSVADFQHGQAPDLDVLTGDLSHYGCGEKDGGYKSKADALRYFLVYHVINIIGKRKMEQFLKMNPGRSPLNKIRDVNWANAVTLLVNSMEKWERAMTVKRESWAEVAKYMG